MSNVLKRKKRKMTPIGYSQQELEGMQKYSRRNTLMENIVQKAYLDTKLMSFLILHDKFGWGLRRITRFESSINQCLEENADRDLHAADYEKYLSEKCKFSITEEVNKIPSRERILFVYDKIPTNPKIASDAAQLVSAAIYNYAVLSCTILRELFHFSGRQLLDYIHWIQYYINSVALWSESGGRRGECIQYIAEILRDECKYCDSRTIC